MSITTYDDLVVEVGAYTHRTDLGPRIGTFVQMAEAAMNTVLKVSEQDNRLVEDVVAVPRQFPQDYKYLKYMTVNGREVEYMSVAQVAQRYRNAAPGQSSNYTIEGRSFTLYPFTSRATVDFVYQARIIPLNEGNQSNPILVSYPELYLWGTLTEAFRFMQDVEAGEAADQIFLRYMDEANLVSERGMQGNGLMMRPS